MYSFILHQLKMGFIEIYAVITLSYPGSIQNSLLLALPVNDFLRKLFPCSLADGCYFSTACTSHCPCPPRSPSFTRFKFIDPIIFGNFHPGAMHRWMPKRENFPNLFTHRWINTFMRIDGHKRKQRSSLPYSCISHLQCTCIMQNCYPKLCNRFN